MVKRRVDVPLSRNVGVNVTAATGAALDRLSDMAGLAVAVVARECLEAGLDRVRDRYRRRKREGES